MVSAITGVLGTALGTVAAFLIEATRQARIEKMRQTAKVPANDR
jgi:hypothetical protein